MSHVMWSICHEAAIKWSNQGHQQLILVTTTTTGSSVPLSSRCKENAKCWRFWPILAILYCLSRALQRCLIYKSGLAVLVYLAKGSEGFVVMKCRDEMLRWNIGGKNIFLIGTKCKNANLASHYICHYSDTIIIGQLVNQSQTFYPNHICGSDRIFSWIFLLIKRTGIHI